MNKNNKLPLFIKIFIILYPISPTYFAINISDDLPLITFSRILLIILVLFSLLKYRSVRKNVLHENIKTYYFFIGILTIYVLSQFIISIANLDIDSINNIFVIIFEDVILFFALAPWFDNKKKIITAIELLVITSGIVSIFAIIEPFTDYNVAYLLDTANRSSILEAGYYRNGLLRSEFTFGHPIALAMYLLLIFPFTMYFCGETNKKRYYIIAILNILACILTSSRSPIIIMGIMFFISMFISKKRVKKSYIFVLVFLVFSGLFFYIFSDTVSNTIDNLFSELIAVFGFGSNGQSDAITVRMSQWSVLNYIFENNIFFGNGIGYITNNDIYYINSNGSYAIMSSIDCEYLEQIIEGGIIGISGFLIFIFGIIKLSLFSKKYRFKKTLILIFGISFFCYFLGYITVSELKPQGLWVFLTLFFSLLFITPNSNVSEKEKKIL